MYTGSFFLPEWNCVAIKYTICQPVFLPSGESVFYVPDCCLEKLKMNRFEPSQAFAMNLKMEEYDQILNLPVR